MSNLFIAIHALDIGVNLITLKKNVTDNFTAAKTDVLGEFCSFNMLQV